MYKLKTSIELPIAHCLYRGAYSGLCCGNVYRDKGQCDGKNDRYDLGDKVLPILHGHLYKITINISSDELDENGMVIDFKKMKSILKEYFDQYDHSMIVTPDNPIVDVYKSTGFEYDKLHIWGENPTAEYMSKYWRDVLTGKFKELKPNSVEVEVEETSHNSVSCTN